jgi:hypothetical protein
LFASPEPKDYFSNAYVMPPCFSMFVQPIQSEAEYWLYVGIGKAETLESLHCCLRAMPLWSSIPVTDNPGECMRLGIASREKGRHGTIIARLARALLERV